MTHDDDTSKFQRIPTGVPWRWATVWMEHGWRIQIDGVSERYTDKCYQSKDDAVAAVKRIVAKHRPVSIGIEIRDLFRAQPTDEDGNPLMPTTCGRRVAPKRSADEQGPKARWIARTRQYA